MSARKKLLLKILSASSDGNIDFSEICTLLKHLGFTLRINGAKCKIYQAKQIRALLIHYKLAEEINHGQ